MKPTKNEYKNFDETMPQLLKVPHSEIKEKLDAEKAAHKGQRGRPKKSNKSTQ